jgi:hypothetical protein
MKASTLFRLGGLSFVLGGLLGPLGHLVLHPLYQVATYAFDAFTLAAIRSTFRGQTATDPNGSFNQFPNGLFPLPLSFPIGLILFGIAIFRSGFGQRWAGIALAVSIVFIYGGGVLAHSPLHLEGAIPLGFSLNALVFAWLGVGLLQGERITSVVPVIHSQPIGGN